MGYVLHIMPVCVFVIFDIIIIIITVTIQISYQVYS